MQSNENHEREKLLPHTAKGLMQVDQGWAWMVMFGSAVCCAISLGIMNNIGVLYVDIETKLNISLIDTSLIGSIHTGCLYLSIFITSPMAHRFGCRIAAMCGGIMGFAALILSSLITSLYVYYACIGVITGVGFSLVYSSGVICLNQYFVKRRALAFLVYLSASGIGMLAFGPLISSLLEDFGLEGTLLVMASIELNVCVGAMLYFPFRHRNASSNGCQQHKKPGLLRVYIDKNLWTRYLFYLILSSFFYGVGFVVIFTLLPEYMVSNGFPLSTAALSITTIGITTTCSRFMLGFISDTFRKLNLWMYICSGILSGTCAFFITLCQSIVDYLVVAGTFGIVYGGFAGLFPVVVVEIMGSDKFPPGFGIGMMAFGIGSFLGSPIAGVLRESTSIAGVEFVVSGVSFILSGLVFLPSVHFRCCSKGADDFTDNFIISESERRPLLDNGHDLKTASCSTV